MRVSVARRNLFRQKIRLVMSVGGVGFAIALILIVWGIYSSFRVKAAEYLLEVPADVWVGQAGVPAALVGGVSMLPVAEADGVAAIEGVRSVRPFTGRLAQVGDDEDQMVYLVGVDPEEPLAAPRRAKGSRIPGPGEIVVDNTFARNNHVAIGDEMRLGSERLRVVGLSSGTDLMGTGYAFVDLSTATKVSESALSVIAPEMLGNTEELAAYFLVRTDGNTEAVVKRIRESSSDLNPMTRQQFVDANLKRIQEGIEPIMWILVLICFGVGAAITGLTIYTATIEKAKEYGVLKAIGFTNARLFRVVGIQSLVASLLGFLTGAVLTVGLSVFLSWRYPMFSTVYSPRAVIGVLLLCVLMSAAAALLPARRLASIDPAEVFRV